tara:strand:+ start:1012 stop:2139 length:1128 start_codon:yes stop_codon:yes gene_type:complete
MRLEDYADLLLGGEDGEKVVRMMRDEIGSICSLRVALTNVRKIVLKSNDPRRFHPNYASKLALLRRLASTASPEAKRKYDRFAGNSLDYKYASKRKCRSQKSFFGTFEMDEVLRSFPIFPENIERFVLPKNIAIKCQKIAKHNLAVQNQNVKIIPDGADLIQGMKNYMQLSIDSNEFVKISEPRLAVCLLLMSGRRSSEILNGKSTFTRGSTPMSVIFDGQLKKNRAGQEEEDLSYEIPLLCTAHLFLAAFDALRKVQNNVKRENKAVNAKYSTNLAFWVHKLIVPAPSRATVAQKIHPHNLRTMYVNLVYALFDYVEVGLSINAVAEWILGHEGMESSLNYNSVVVRDLPPLFPKTSRPAPPKLAGRIKKAVLT